MSKHSVRSSVARSCSILKPKSTPDSPTEIHQSVQSSRQRKENKRIGVIQDSSRKDLDYQLFRLYSMSVKWNEIMAPGNGTKIHKYVYPQRVATTTADCSVLSAMGTTGTVRGIIIDSSYYIKTAFSRTFQELWPVKLERETGTVAL